MNLRSVLAGYGLLLLCNTLSAAAAGEITRHSVFLDIPALPVCDALHELRWQANAKVIYERSDCGASKAPKIFGTFSVAQALQTLLRNTQLRYEVLEDGAIGIFPTTPGSAETEKPHGSPAPRPRPPAQNPIDSGTSQQEVVITGSHIHDNETVSPVKIYTRRTLEDAGVGSLAAFLPMILQDLRSNSKSTYVFGDGQNGAHGTSFNLLGLGEPGTLVLLDGRRVAASALGNFVDVSLIPFAVIDRIEVLTGAAAAVYGGDSVAGVVNIILRREFEGLETNVGQAWPDHSGASQFWAAQTAGNSWTGGHVVASLSYSSDKPLLSTERPYSNTPGYDLTPGLTDYSGYLFVDQMLSPNFSVDVDGLYTHRATVNHIDYLLNGTQVGPYGQNGVTHQYSFAPALNWTWGSGWHGVAEFSISANRFTELTTYAADAMPSVAPYSTMSDARVRTADVRVDGPFAQLPGGDAKLAVGAGGRWEDYHSVGSSTPGFASGSFDRRVRAGYGELNLPVVGARNSMPALRKLDFDLAVRAERYSDAGFTANPRVGFTWQPIEHLSIRSTYGTSFATARFADTLTAYNAMFVLRTPSSTCASGSCLLVEEFGANSSYRPERSRSYNVGVDWAPEYPAGLQLGADFYSISYLDQISSPPNVETLLTHSANFAGLVVPDPNLRYISNVLARGAMYPQGVSNLAGSYDPSAVDFYIDGRTRNLAQTFAKGIDFHMLYSVSSRYAAWTLELLGSRVLKLENRASPDAPGVSVIDTFAHPLARRYEGRVRVQFSNIAIQLQANYAGRYTNTLVSPPTPVSGWTTLDAMLVAPLDGIFTGWGTRARLELNVKNLLNRDPPYVETPQVPDGYDPVNADALGRVITVRLVLRM